MTTSPDHDEYAAAAAQPPQGDTVKPYLKSGAAFVIAFATALYATVQGRTDVGTMKTSDWLIVVLGALVTAGATFYAPYESTKPSA
jgi:hypothetical protein